MKNIHVLPTDKPSRLLKSDFKITLLDIPSNEWKKPNINIYITSDEEIKEGDWCYHPLLKGGSVIQSKFNNPNSTMKKIILTTDQDLIKNGVQAIDEEFLEWFVKNPSCEEVEVIPYLEDIINPLTNEKFPAVQHRHFDETKMIFRYHYKIINPKTTQEIIDEDFSGGLDLGQIIPKEEPKQETLEEASSRCAIQENKSSLYELGMKYFQLGAKWQAERMYSEEGVIDLIQFLSMNKEFNEYSSVSKETARYFLEQFKKK